MSPQGCVPFDALLMMINSVREEKEGEKRHVQIYLLR